MGRFVVEQLPREGVDTRGVKVDPERLTALVLLGIRDEEQFPLIFYRENCADMGLTEADIDEGFIAEAGGRGRTGTHFSNSRTAAAVLKALTLARKHGGRTALDIDYRPSRAAGVGRASAEGAPADVGAIEAAGPAHPGKGGIGELPGLGEASAAGGDVQHPRRRSRPAGRRRSGYRTAAAGRASAEGAPADVGAIEAAGPTHPGKGGIGERPGLGEAAPRAAMFSTRPPFETSRPSAIRVPA